MLSCTNESIRHHKLDDDVIYIVNLINVEIFIKLFCGIIESVWSPAICAGEPYLNNSLIPRSRIINIKDMGFLQLDTIKRTAGAI